MATAPFPVHEELTGISLAYKNDELIADMVLPRLDPMGKEEFKWYKWNLAEGFTVPDTKVGRRSAPQEIEFNATEQTDKTQDYGLDDPVPYNDIANAAGQVDPLARATEGLTDLIGLDREVRTSALVFANATYPAANRQTLAGTTQWSDYTNSDPVQAIMAALDVPVLRPNTAVFGRATFTKLSTHPKMLSAAFGPGGNAGVARREDIARVFELREVLVGASWLNTAKKGQAATLARVWGKHAAFLRINPLLKNVAQTQISFGFTAQYGTRTAGSKPDDSIGLRGGERVRVGESVKEVIAANDIGYFFENAVA